MALPRNKLCIVLVAAAAMLPAQNALVFNGGYAVLNGGTAPTAGAYLVVNQPAVTGITRTASGGGVRSEAQFNYVKWLNNTTASGNFVFPFYQSAGNYIPFTVSKTGGTTDMAVSTWGTPANNMPLALANGNTLGTANGAYPTATNLLSVYGGSAATLVDRWWDVNSSGTINGTLTFSYLGSENSPGYGNLYAQVWKNYLGTYQWTNPVHATTNTGVVFSIGNTSLTAATALTGFWILGDQAVILENINVSVEMTCNNSTRELLWTATAENDADHYLVERSPDGINFLVAASVAAQSQHCAPACSGNYNYAVQLPDAVPGEYYRVSLVKTSGQVIALKTLADPCTAPLIDSASFYTNGESGFFSVGCTRRENYTLELLDMRGRLLLSDNKTAEKGENKFAYDLSFLPNGVYLSRIIGDGKNISGKFIISR